MSQYAGPDVVARPNGIPDAVWSAVESVRAMSLVDGVHYREIAVPSKQADFGIGVELTCGNADGWMMVLYATNPPVHWKSHWRCAAYAHMLLPTAENDGLTPTMYWDDMCSRLDGIDPDSVSGTVTMTRDTVFSSTSQHVPTTSIGVASGCEMRVSWTPIASMDDVLDAGGQIRLWARFIHAVVSEQEEPSVDR